jgi:ubiquitin related modifier 1
MASISLKVQFSGGLESLFSSKPSHPLILNLTIPAFVPTDNSTDNASPNVSENVPVDTDLNVNTKLADVAYLIHHLRDRYLKERVELFMDNGTV